MKAGYFVFKKTEPENTAGFYDYVENSGTLSELKKYLNAWLKDGANAKDFLIIRGRKEKIKAVKVIAEIETVET